MSKDVRSRLANLSEQERRSLVDRLLQGRKAASATEIQPQPRTSDRFPLSYAQQRYWVLNQIFPNTSGFNVVRVFHLAGALDRAALAASLSDLTRRHEALRTTFVMDGDAPVQHVRAAFDLTPAYVDLRGLSRDAALAEVARLARQEGQGSWDLAAAPPIRASVWQLADDEHALLLSMHHIVADGWSMNTMVKELFACYDGRRQGREPALPPVALQYADYAIWHRDWMQSESFAAQLAFWRRRLEGAPALRLPASATPPTAAGLTRRVMIGGETVQRLKSLTQSEGVTSFMALLSAFSVVLAAYADQDGVVVGCPVASRTRPELESVVGCFMNPLPFRVDLAGGLTFRQLLARVRDVALEVYANQDVPFDAVVKAAAPGHRGPLPPLYQAMFLLHNFPTDARRALQSGAAVAGLQVSPWPLPSGTR